MDVLLWVPRARGETAMTSSIQEGVTNEKSVRHGTVRGYVGDLCRCPDCRGAWRDYMRPYMRRRRAFERATRVLEKEGK